MHVFNAESGDFEEYDAKGFVDEMKRRAERIQNTDNIAEAFRCEANFEQMHDAEMRRKEKEDAA